MSWRTPLTPMRSTGPRRIASGTRVSTYSRFSPARSGRPRRNRLGCPSVEGFADRPAEVTGAGAAVAQYLRRACHQDGADAASFHMGRDPDATDGGGCRPEHRQEYGVRAGAIKQQGGDDRSRGVPGEQGVLVAGPEPASPARESGGLEG